MKINMLCQKYKQENSSTGKSLCYNVHAASIWKRKYQKETSYSWLTYFLCIVSQLEPRYAAGWKAHLYFMFPLTLYIKSKIVGWKRPLHPCLFFFQRMVQWPNLLQCSLLPFFTFQVLFRNQHQESKNSCPLNKPKKCMGGTGQISSLQTK